MSNKFKTVTKKRNNYKSKLPVLNSRQSIFESAAKDGIYIMAVGSYEKIKNYKIGDKINVNVYCDKIGENNQHLGVLLHVRKITITSEIVKLEFEESVKYTKMYNFKLDTGEIFYGSHMFKFELAN